MKQLLAIIIAGSVLTSFATEPTKPAEPAKTEMKLAKKKADKDAEAKAKADTKSQDTKKTEAPKK